MARGRSASDPSAINSVKMGKTAPDTLPPLFAAGHEEAWNIFRFGPEYPQVYPGMQFPLEAQAELWKQLVPDWYAALSTSGIAGIVAIEPTVCPVATADMAPYTRMPILVLYGDNIDKSPRWAPRLTKCREFIDAVAKAGGNAKLVLLPDVGFHGNSHMLMQDRNSLKVADWLLAWIDRNIERKS